MKWISHTAIAGACAAMISPAHVPAAVAGATAPDWLEWVLGFAGHRVRHRTVTHYLAAWLLLAAFGMLIWDYHHHITAFALGGASHVICDAMTIQGVPFGWWSDRRFHIFGGRLKTGSAAEYLVAGAFVLAAAMVANPLKTGFVPFFYDWAGLYSRGLIDGHEWRTNRFRFL